MPTGNHWLCSWNQPVTHHQPQGHYDRSKEGHREGHKGSPILRSPTTRRRERMPMSNQWTTSNTRRHIRQRQCTAQVCIRLLFLLNSMRNSATDRRWARLQSKTPPARKPALLTTLSSNLRCVSRQLSPTLLNNTRKPAGPSSKNISEGATDHEIPARTFS